MKISRCELVRLGGFAVTYDGERNLAIQFADDGSAVIHQCLMFTSDVRYLAQPVGNSDRTAFTANLVNDQKLDMRLRVQP